MVDDFGFNHSNPNYSSAPGDYFNSGTSYFKVTSQNEANVDVDKPDDDEYFFGAQQLNGGTHILSYNDMDITNSGDLVVLFGAAEDDAADGMEDWDADDKVIFQYRIDNGSWVDLFTIAGTGTDTEPRVNGVDALTDTESDFDAVISDHMGTDLDFQIVFEGLTEADEDFALGYFAIIAVAGADDIGEISITAPNDNHVYPAGTGTVTISYTIPDGKTTEGIEVEVNGTLVTVTPTALTGNGTFDLTVANNMSYSVTAYAIQDGFRVESSSVSFEVEDATASTEDNQIDGFSIFPNPVVNGEFSLSSTNGGVKTVKLYNTIGKLVLETSALNKQAIQVGQLTSGIYILRVVENNKTAVRKLVIK